MKNFTKQITNKALFKPTRWLLIAFMFLLGTGGAWGATVTFTSDDVLFFNMNAVSWWTAGTNGNGNFAYFYNNSTNKNAWSAHAVQYSGDVYYVKIPAGTWEGVILTRNNTSTAPTWDNKWNQTGDISLSSTSNYISKFSENSTSATWSTQKPTSTGKLTASSTSVNTNTSVTLTPSLTSYTTYNEIKSTTYAISPSTGASISGNTFIATAAGTYTVTATITYNPRGYSSLTSTVTATTTITVNSSTYTVKKSETGGTGTVTLGGTTITTSGVSISSGSKALSITAPTGYNVNSVAVSAGTLTAGTTGLSSYNGTVNVTAATTITITYVAKTYTITYKDQGGANFSGTHASGYPTTHTYGTATTLKTASKTGYTFGGWFTDSNCTQKVTSLGATAYTANITLYAKWTEEAGVKIAALGSTALYTNDPTHFIPMYVSNEYLAGVGGATSVKKYTWQFSANGTSGWADCTRNYGNFNAKNNKSNSKVVVSNGGEKSNNYRANQVGYYRCKLTYDNDEEQVSGNIQVTAATNNKTNKQHIGITYNLPIISVNTGANSFPSDAGLATKSSNCGSGRYPSIHADKMKEKISVDVMMFNPDGSICYDRKARMNYRGSSSLNFQKKSYAFVTGKEKTKNLDGDVDTGKANLFGLSNGAEDKDWVLYAATPDPSMMRNRLVFDLYQKMRNLGVGQDDTKEWGVNSMYVELVVNGEYRGVYVLMDKITCNANRVNIKNENGFIVKFDKTDVVDRVENAEGDQKTFATSRTGTKNSSNGIESYKSCIDQRFEIEYPEKEDIELWDAFYGNVQQRFENFETALANKDYATVRTLIDYDSWADWFIITELAKNQDGFRASCIFVYDGDKIEARPLWDQELSFNNGTRVKHGIDSPEGLLITTSSVYNDAFYPPFWFTGHKETSVTGGLLNDPCFVSLVKQKWATYQSGVCSAASIGDMVADYNTELGNAISREAARWPYTEEVRGTTTDGDYVGYYSQGEGNPSQYSYAASKNAITAWIADRSTALTAGSGLGKAINDLNGEALIFTLSPSSVETTPWQQVMITVNAPDGYEYTFDDSSINNATVKATVKKSNDTYAIKIPRPSAWGVGGNGNPDTQTQYQVSATIEVSGESECGTIQNGTATSTITLKDVTEVCDPEIVKP